VEVGTESAPVRRLLYATVAVPVAPFVEASVHPDTKTLLVAALPRQIAPTASPAVSETVTVVVADEVVAPNAPSVTTEDGVPEAVT
jgi:hypothetical protein